MDIPSTDTIIHRSAARLIEFARRSEDEWNIRRCVSWHPRRTRSSKYGDRLISEAEI